MWTQILRLVGRQAAHRLVSHQTRGTKLDFRFGLTLWRDRRIPGKAKFLAFALGLFGMFLVNLLEIPAETVLAVALPVLGIPIDIAWNGLENLLGPLLLMAWALPCVAPRPLVEQIRQEQRGPIIDL